MGLLTTYKPASHVKAGEWVYGPLTRVSLVSKVLSVELLDDEYKMRFALQSQHEHTATAWKSDCIKVRRWWMRWAPWGRQ